jgi:DNA repair protein RecO (recombination protein O)
MRSTARKRNRRPFTHPKKLGAVVLYRAEVGESDLIVTFLTREMGVLVAIAKNAKKSVKRFGGGLLSPGRAAYYEFKFSETSDLNLVVRGENNPKAPLLPNIPIPQALAAWALELVKAFETPGNPATEVFNLLVRHIYDLSVPPPHEPPALEARTLSLSFTKHYLEKAGFASSVMDSCHFCQSNPKEGEFWRWETAEPKLICPQCLKYLKERSPAVPAELLAKLSSLPPPMKRMAPFTEEELFLAENFYELLASRAAGRGFRSKAVIRSLLK